MYSVTHITGESCIHPESDRGHTPEMRSNYAVNGTRIPLLIFEVVNQPGWLPVHHIATGTAGPSAIRPCPSMHPETLAEVQTQEKQTTSVMIPGTTSTKLLSSDFQGYTVAVPPSIVHPCVWQLSRSSDRHLTYPTIV